MWGINRKTIKRLVSAVRKRPGRFLTAVLIVVLLGVGVQLRGKYVATVFGFLDTDFVLAENGNAYQTASEPFFTAAIADSADATITRLRMSIEGKAFALTYQPTLATGSATIATPSSFATETFEQASTSAATDSAVVGRYALLSELDALNNQILSKTGTTEQAFEGPFEVIRHEGSFPGIITYLVQKHTLVEQWSARQLLSSELSFLAQSQELTLVILPDQTWEYRDGARAVMRVATRVQAADGSEISLPMVAQEQLLPGKEAAVVLVLPEDIAKKESAITITRTYQPVHSDRLSAQQMLVDTVGETLATQSALLSFPPSDVIPVAGGYIVRSGLDGAVGKVLMDGSYSSFSLSVESLGCRVGQCVGSHGSDYVVFSDDPLFSIASESSQRVTVGDGPIGAVAVTEKAVYRTANSSPQGGVYRLPSFEKDEQEIYSQYANATEIAVQESLGLIAFWGNGQVYLGSLGGSVKPVVMDEKLSSLSFGADGNLYGILPYPERTTAMIARVLPGGDSVEVLTNVYGKLASVTAADNALILSLQLSDQQWAIVPIPWQRTRWHTLEQQSGFEASSSGIFL